MLKSNRSLLVGILSIAASSAAVAANWDSCDKWATWINGGYTLYNNVWGANPGWQCIWANTGSHWRVSCNHGTSGGIKSYPNSNRDLNRSANNVSSCRTTFNVSRHSNGRLYYNIRRLGQWQRLRDHVVDEQGWRGGPYRVAASFQSNDRRTHVERVQGHERQHPSVLFHTHEQHQLGHGRSQGNLELGPESRLVEQSDHRQKAIRL
jgi:hypothetical protein